MKDFGIPYAEKKYLAGVSAQFDSEEVYHNVKEILTSQGVIYMDMSEAVKKYPILDTDSIDYSNSEKVDVVETIKELTRENGVDCCIEGTGASEPLGQALLACNAERTVLVMGNPQGNIELSQQQYWAILRKQLHVCGTWNSSHNQHIDDWQTAIKGLYDNTIDGKSLITHRYDFSEYQVAFNKLREKQEHVCKVMFINE